MRWFKQSNLEPLAVSIAGVKLGERLLVLGCGDPVLIAQQAIKTGLTGRACAVDEERARTERAAVVAEQEGALIETITTPWLTLPLDADAFDIVVVRDVLAALAPHQRPGCLNEVRRVLRPGGRCLAIDSAPRGMLGRLSGGSTASAEYAANGGAVRLLEAAAFRATRTVAEREGLVFVEGVKGMMESKK
jgi:ubiquinone/menaquinone biosynthesis C-methylase UbiE